MTTDEPTVLGYRIDGEPVKRGEPSWDCDGVDHAGLKSLAVPNPLHRSMEVTFARCLEISRAKNADYADNADPFANFRRSEVVGVPVARGILVRLMDKVARVSNLLEHPPAVADEKVADTLEDAINYLAILKAWLELEEP